MQNPLQTFQSIQDFYITYLETAFRIGDPEIQRKRRLLLETPEALSTEPFLEPLPQYLDYGLRIDDLSDNEHGRTWLPGFSPRERQAFIDLCLAGLIPADKAEPTKGRFKLFTHQLEMLRNGIGVASPGIVTSGTGSGKTESFLLPILAAISREATGWTPSPRLGSWVPWWKDEETWPTFPREAPWESSTRPKAVRALVLYPMNALVEDQMVRLRRALDSDAAHTVMSRHFGGNRIFFGRYTGATKVTGWLEHPRIKTKQEQERAARRVAELRKYMRLLEETHTKAVNELSRGRSGTSDESLPFNFPRPLGGEVVSRWDMQRHPPDILITNTSMLSTMLVREIDEGIFAQTREWLQSDPNAYFYLVLDELHLQRGSAGTEVAYLLRAVLEQLGLHHPQHRHKLRVLCSSASLPVDGDLGEQSLDYLWGFFGNSGLPSSAKREDWRSAIVRGASPQVPNEAFTGRIEEFRDAVDQMKSQVEESQGLPTAAAWGTIAEALALPPHTGPTEDLAALLVAKAGRLLEVGCTSGGASRATAISNVAANIFGRHQDAVAATHALVWLRSCSDKWDSWFGREFPHASAAPRFRVHTFIRAIEGLFAAPRPAPIGLPLRERTDLLFGDLTVESGVRYGHEIDGRRTRRVDLLYCECCGTLFFGGRKGRAAGGQVELLPNDPDTESLPERAKVNQVEQRSAEEYALFMPVVSRFAPIGNEQPDFDDAQGAWKQAEYDTFSATITPSPPILKESDRIAGWLYHVDPDPAKFRGEIRRNQSSWTDSGSALPFQCPACAISYRKAGGRSSPIRGFRVGFAKTTQLLASSLMAELQRSKPNERLVSFSDSRQDAAKAAFDLEGGHHDDVRRELVVRSMQEIADRLASPEQIQRDITRASSRQKELVLKDERTDDEEDELAEISRTIAELRTKLKQSAQDCLPLRDIVEPIEPQMGAPLRPLLAGLVQAGIHPIDRTGVSTVPESTTTGIAFAWQQLFERTAGAWCWARSPSRIDDYSAAFRCIATELLKLVGGTVFSKTYFAVEESGWGYPCLPVREGITRAQLAKFDAMLRVLADSYRLDPSPFDGPISIWSTGADAMRMRRLAHFLRAVGSATGDDPLTLADELLSEMQRAGHLGGIVSIANLHYKPVAHDAHYWRCVNCGRIHLHRGATVCTRCGTLLADDPNGTVTELRASSFLGKRILLAKGLGIRRMRAEELTGMTNNPAARLRRFKGILINDEDDILPLGFEGAATDPELDMQARVVDVLSVTTTMEVGVDIGDLRSVFQANMPPQRFNYQQRVGRAGRRGQAFSFVLTVCRSKSHDLHYFRNPAQITGDPPPPPFLTTTLNQIASRLILKIWFVAAFRELRRTHARGWPGDELRVQPDNHGEFFRVRTLREARPKWLPRIKAALTSCEAIRDQFALLCFQGEAARTAEVLAALSVEAALRYIEIVLEDRSLQAKGLAEALAEHGYFPMYGMPTRVRLLHTRPTGKGNDLKFLSMDRDLDVAIQEFAPGKVLVQDKRRYFTAGYAGETLQKDWASPSRFNAEPRELGIPRYLVECSVCLSWSRASTPTAPQGTCLACGYDLSGSSVHTAYAPFGFITSLVTKKPDESGEENTARAAKTSVAEAEPLVATKLEGSNVRIGTSTQSQVYRLNRGEFRDGAWVGWHADQGDIVVPYRNGGPQQRLYVNGVWIDPQAAQLDSSSSPISSRFVPRGEHSGPFYLAAPKVTDSLVLVPDELPPQLAIVATSQQGQRTLSSGFRAGALSALFLLVNHASREILDVDPDEFEILEPRLQATGDGAFLPVLQLCDDLVNGSGLTNRLSQPSVGSSSPIIWDVIRRVAATPSQSPLADLLAEEHAKSCYTGCYKCLHRYGNQAYHGLLDWRLGLDVLHLLLSRTYVAGFDDDFSYPGVHDWPEIAKRLASEAAALLGGEVTVLDGVPTFRLAARRWAAVVHPFWSVDRLKDSKPELDSFGLENDLQFVTTFDLSRRMGESLSRLKEANP
ncbi:DEAD/DEAH box helicase [Ramlibacter sp.]|uniref:DEAD/DEAH box helicase n=1 Tax=Ramlibacter sp. TaxID=1917967 RepID=UPI002FC5A337